MRKVKKKIGKGEKAIFGRESESERRERERNEKSRERNLSLRYMEIRLWVFIGVRGKVYLRDKSYAWAPK